MSLRACREVRADLSAYLDGDLDAALADQTRAHLENCAGCRSELELLRRATGALRALPELPPPAGILAGVRARLQPAPWHRRLAEHRQWRLGVPVGALATVLVIVGLSLLQTRQPEVAQNVAKSRLPQSPAPAARDRVADRQDTFAAVEPKVGQSPPAGPGPRIAAQRQARREKALSAQKIAAVPPAELQSGSERSVTPRRLRVVCLLTPDGDTVDDLTHLLRREGASEVEVNELEPRAVREAFDSRRGRLAALPEPSRGWTVTARVPPRSLPRLLEGLASRAGLRILERPAAPDAPEDPAKPLALQLTVLR